MDKTTNSQKKSIEILFKGWVSKSVAGYFLSSFGFYNYSRNSFGESSGKITIKVAVPADEVKEWIEKLKKEELTVDAVREVI